MSSNKYQGRPSWKALCISTIIGFFLPGLYLWFGLMVGRLPFLAVLVIIVTKRVIPSLTKADHLFTVVAILSTSAPTIAAGFVGVVPALKFCFPKEQARLQTSWIQLVFWSMILCIPGLFFATALRETALVRWKLPYKIANTLADQIAVWHHELNTQDRGPVTMPQEEASPHAQPLEEREYEPLNADQEISLKRHLGIPIGLATLGVFLTGFSLNIVGMGMLAPPQVAVGLLSGAFFRYILSGWVEEAKTGSDDYNETGVQSSWLVVPGLGAIFGDAGPQILVSMLASCFSKTDSTGALQRPSEQTDAQSSASPDELSSLLSGVEALRDEDPVHQTTAEIPESKNNAWSLKSISIFALWILLPMHWLLIDIPTNGLMPIGASFLSMLMGLLMGFVSVWLMGRTSSNAVSDFGKLSQFLFILCYRLYHPNPLANPVQTLIVVGGVTEAFASTAADAMDYYKIAQTLEVSPIVVFQAQAFGVLVGSLACPFWFLVGLPRIAALFGKDPFKEMPSAKLWLASARLAAEGDVPVTIWWITGIIFVIFMLTSLLKIRKPQIGWFFDGGSFALGMCNTIPLASWWSAGSVARLLLIWYELVKLIVRACWRKDLRDLGTLWRDARPAGGGQENRVMLWGIGLLLGESPASVVRWLCVLLGWCSEKTPTTPTRGGCLP